MSCFSRRRFFFDAQDSICALRITDGCKNRGGLMEFDKLMKGGRQPFDLATWDHVYPKRHRRRLADEDLQLLACAQCNHARGQKAPTVEYIARGQDLLDRWRKHRGESQANIELRQESRRIRAERQLMRRAMQRQPEIQEALREKRPFSIVESSNARKKRRALEALAAELANIKPPPPARKRAPGAQNPPGSKRARRDMQTVKGSLARAMAQVDPNKRAELLNRCRCNAESQAAAMRGKAERAERRGDLVQAEAMRRRADAMLAVFAPPETTQAGPSA